MHEESVDITKSLVNTNCLRGAHLRSYFIQKVSLLHAELKPLYQHEYFKTLTDMSAAIDIYRSNNKYCQSISDQILGY